MNYFRPLLIFILSFVYTNISAQSIFDKMENWLTSHHIHASYGPQWASYTNSNIRFVQENYQRDVIFEDVAAHDNPALDFYLKGQFGVPQFRFSMGVELSPKYSIVVSALHLTYLVDVNQTYYRLGTWDGMPVTGDKLFSEHFTRMEHSNGINLWTVGVRRNFRIKKFDLKNVNFNLGWLLHAGPVLTSTEATVINPSGEFEEFDPGNTVAGFNYASETTFRICIKDHWEFIGNFNYFQMFINKAYLDEDSYVKQRLRGFNTGISFGYRL